MTEEASSESITDVVTHLHNLLQTKEKELKEREADFDRRVKLFESTNPTIGSDNDIIQLNVGGRTNIAVLRNLLTQFDDSMLAAKFSGRWDDSMERDRDGNVFVDQDPDSFMNLITYLRMRMNNQLKLVPNIHRPRPTYKFCTMLEYYNLLPGIYPQTWVGGEPFDCEEIAYGTVTLSSVEGEYATVAHPYLGMSTPEIIEFTVEFDKGTCGAVGWVYCKDDGHDSKISRTFNEVMGDSLFLNIAERKVFGPTEILEQNMRVNHADSTTKVVCQRSRSLDQNKKIFSIAVGDNAKVAATVADGLRNNFRVLPMIHFSGKVTVSGIKYDIDGLTLTG
jgi:hypothetical protein